MTEEESDRLCEARMHAAVQRERGAIVFALQELGNTLHSPRQDSRRCEIAEAVHLIRARGQGRGHGDWCNRPDEQKPEKIARLDTASFGVSIFGDFAAKVNELIDAENARRG